MTHVFTERFLDISPDAIAEAIQTDGYFCLERAVTDAWMADLTDAVKQNSFAINQNWVTGVHSPGQYYLTHMLACSQAFYNYACSVKLRSVCDRVLGDRYRLKAQRYYETYGYHHMQWHTDNKTDRTFAQIPGLIFIVYLQDVTDGEFQYVRGSQRWSGDKAYSDYSEAYIEEHCAAEVVSFKAPKGTIIIYDTYGIHRAKPVMNSGFSRKSLFFQVDANMDSGEPILLNPAFVANNDLGDAKLREYLGFGLKSEYHVFPHTSLNTLPVRAVSMVAVLKWLMRQSLRFCYDRMPLNARNFLRRLCGRTAI